MFVIDKFVRTALVAVTIGAAGMSAMPAEAAPSSHGHSGYGHHWSGPGFHRPMVRPFHPVRPVCMPDRQVRRAINHAGYSRVVLYGHGGVRVMATATRGRWAYRLTVNRCTGHIIAVTRLRHR